MPKRIQKFRAETATPTDLRSEAEAIGDIAAALMWMRDRGHLDSEQAVWALKLYSGARERVADFNRRARALEASPINTVPT